MPASGGRLSAAIGTAKVTKTLLESRTMRCAVLASAFLCGMGLVGCGGSTDPSPAAGQAGAGTQAAASQAKPVSVPAGATPDQVVSVFLDALRGGDQATTASLLTSKALTETSKQNLSVCPQATPNMEYTVTKSEVLPENPNGAHVSVHWTENYSDGKVEYDVVWVLRRQQDGWRIAGMAIELVPGQGLAFLNFEDPDDMIRKQEQAEQAMAALEQPAAETAALPGDNAATGPTKFQQPTEQVPPQEFAPAPSSGSRVER
jgi:hypothetical protein